MTSDDIKATISDWTVPNESQLYPPRARTHAHAHAHAHTHAGWAA